MTDHRATTLDLFEEMAAKHFQRPEVGRRRMFGHDGLNVNGKFFAFLNGDRLALKLLPAKAAEPIAAREAVVADN
jgi:TfoX/Sxy family transcriptional regulator of competence genes